MNRTDDVDARSVAVIGMACRLPGADGPDELWDLLRDGVDATSETPPDRYDVNALHSERPGPGMIGSRRGGYLGGMADFDAEFFEMSPTEALELDPQQRLLLMTAWDALEDAGRRPDELAGTRTGVFVGNARGDYLEIRFRQGLQTVTAAQLNNYRSLLPARLSYFLDLRGPSVVLDTACSSSLAAVHSAVQSLRAGESPLAIVAGVNLTLRPDEGVVMTQAGALAADGRSKFADAGADGHTPGDAVGVVVLKRLTDALADGDPIRAVIEGSAIGNDGRTSGSLLNPSRTGQVEVLRWAYEDAGVSPADVDYVEAHGSGSPVLDALEITALGEVLGEDRPSDRPLLVGSVKTNIGHAEAAGGIAGLIKTVLCLEHGQVPASLHLGTPTPEVPWGELPVLVPEKLHDLPDHGRPYRAGISGQGSSALNAHVVIRQADPRPHAATPAPDGKPYLLALSARTPEALVALRRSWAAYLGPEGPGTAHPLRDICYSAATRRQHHEHRLAVVGASHEEMAAAFDAAGEAPRRRSVPKKLAEAADRYRENGTVDWQALAGEPGRFVPLPRYPWQTKRYWPDDEREERTGDLADWVLREHARTSYDDDSTLVDVGIDSLAKLRIIVELSEQTGREVDPEELGGLRTVGALRGWIRAMEAHTP
ncbi:beta-ketoacyl synthase N-terminal-like domain-containing protein [Streptomyces peucetius]|uniref:Phosphopantetheine-binding protein n=1 Tax=Streptomyces peucetius TaxID=1950 RepID=A0ABY6IK46_STRPE|nr:beta-ketoacyl synthase N-terminal-like domain-containing protein [Streptomyces peucetius]UYQ66070.1 phosphopantetheine-binding protein [Streptomyces peucetius]